MNRSIFFVTLRELLSQPVRLGSLLGACLIPLITTAVDPDPVLAEVFWATVFAVLSSAGLIGQEISSGTLALVFARPVKRLTYLLCRWSAAATMASTMSVLQVTLQSVVISARIRPVPIAALLATSVDRLFLAVGVTAVLAFLSCLSSGFGDVVIWAAMNVIAETLQLAGKEAALPSLSDAGSGLAFLANPTFDAFEFVGSLGVPWSKAFLYLAAVLGTLALGALALNRRQLSYASE